MNQLEISKLIENTVRKVLKEYTEYYLDNKKLPNITSNFFEVHGTTLQHIKTDAGEEFYKCHPGFKIYNTVRDILNIKTKNNIGAELHYNNFLTDVDKLFTKYKKNADKLNKNI